MGELMSQAKVIRPELNTTNASVRTRRIVNFEAEYFLNALIALGALVFLAPLMIVVALAVYLQDGGPIFFAHRRIGKDGRAFPCLKFRSMAVDAEARLKQLLATDPAARAEWTASHKLKVDPRVTPLGDFLRRLHQLLRPHRNKRQHRHQPRPPNNRFVRKRNRYRKSPSARPSSCRSMHRRRTTRFQRIWDCCMTCRST